MLEKVVVSPLEQYRSYLLILARIQFHAIPRGRIDPSDIVQQTLLEAHVQQGQYRGDKAKIGAWLRKALANNMRDALRHVRRRMRDARRERSLEEMIDASSGRLGELLAMPTSSPSCRAVRQEELLRLADAIWQLPDAQRESLMLHYLQGWTLAEVAAHLGRSGAAVAGLLHRGLRKLRELLEAAEPESTR